MMKFKPDWVGVSLFFAGAGVYFLDGGSIKTPTMEYVVGLGLMVAGFGSGLWLIEKKRKKDEAEYCRRTDEALRNLTRRRMIDPEFNVRVARELSDTRRRKEGDRWAVLEKAMELGEDAEKCG